MLQLLFVSSVCIQSNARYVFVYTLPVPLADVLDRNKSRLYLGRLLLLILRISSVAVFPVLFHLFNLTCSKDSSYSTFDANDYKTVLDSGLLIYGASPVANWNDPVALSRLVRENLVNNLLTGDVSVDSASHAGVIVVGGKDELDTIKQSSLDDAFDQLSRLMADGSTVHRGIYSGDKPGVTIFTTVGGIKNISQKIKQLANAAR